MQVAEVRVAYRGRQAAIHLSDSAATVRQLSEAIEREFQVAPSTQKLLVGGKVLWPEDSPGLSYHDAGMTTCHLCLVASLHRSLLYWALSMYKDCQLQALQALQAATGHDELIPLSRWVCLQESRPAIRFCC